MLSPALATYWIFGFGILGLLALVLWVVGLVDAARRPDLDRGKRAAWILLIVIFPIVGTLVYLATRPTLPDERDKIIAARTGHAHRLDR